MSIKSREKDKQRHPNFVYHRKMRDSEAKKIVKEVVDPLLAMIKGRK